MARKKYDFTGTLLNLLLLGGAAVLLKKRTGKLSGCEVGARRRYFGGNSGYEGYSKSKRAIAAEERGLRNKSQMNKEFADEVNEQLQELDPGHAKITLKAIKDNLQNIIADEWHHTSMYGNETNYYSAKTVASYFVDHDVETKDSKNAKKLMKRI